MKNFLKKFSGLEKKIKNATISKRSSQIESLEDGEDEYDASTEDELEEDEEYEESEEEESGEENSKEWLQKDFEEGQLSIDVFQTPDKLIVKSTIAGVKPEDIDISINNDMLTIRGKRDMYEEIKDEDYLYKECYWGSFSRSIILPVEVEADKIEAFLENGVLTVTLPKAKNAKQISIKVREK
ncbi:hypothetical protein A2331_05570 [Candidatus Falkowbacteria bacterium RIFOXYB2_FULL_34_18]|uniref:SHSP domain-containing protein n=1 Tax=Candidatus Falkowbacteria bacterium RIFOXYD2_FULL_34_120 TaxID=1798007 RepID=A0A1F5TR96_9BACT|nr:MAG: hypothetical protein A2331_05570 [Candidatus Falkowbacteria bacterium RIFOXYB2_FULL_34_18]OGF29823.1 MAG: hypothetical protein A2500_01460 [Candidatus Falkowbacteria bacterium RIFOXYC12_FULL_34_55]OGF37062.1 MAG: hypothetical protein A2466_05745 [Candidatus Falkowbacteria bacterium RIFOXYC2_FULL_34_220]OGF39254.1 MAG: hypothetical protein A2515_00955 [Candidatus Falkowbacteria bacterium RIFOXYD12_FULL_34_57]OGF41359.1 MAG: hypothetical protein A2531_07165 [Candidatus Falkowbacteria bact